MAKKMFDILPPQKTHKIEDGFESLRKERPVRNAYSSAGGKKQSRERVNKKQNEEVSPQKERTFPLKEFLIGCGILVLILFGFLYFKLQKAEVEIWPKTEVLSFKEQILTDDSVDLVDLNSKTIPAQYFEEEKDLWQEFSATGNASNDGKAEGTITVYNKYSPASSLTLKTGTHFLSDSGKYFITLQKVVVPAAKKENNKIIPGSIEVKVQATESGEDYNIKPSKFSVPKLSGTSYYYSIYAESFKEMTGGFSGEVKKVTEEDIQKAKEALTEKLLNDARESLKNKIGSEYVLLDNAIFAEIIDSSSAVKAGAVVDKFNYQAKSKTIALVFKKSDLESLVKEYINSNMSDENIFLEDSLNLNYSSETVDIKDKKTVLDLDFSVKAYKAVDKNDFILLFREKSENQIKETINSKMGDQVSQIKVSLWPFWTIKAPKDKNKIKVDLRFE